MTRRVATLIAMTVGALALLDFFVEAPPLDSVGTMLTDWLTIVMAFALVLGLWNLAHRHGRKIVRRDSGWPYSLALLVSAAAVIFLGLRPGSAGPADAGVSWSYRYVYSPLNATVFSLLAFFVGSAAYRAFRLRSRESAVLLVVGVLVLLGQVPLGFQIRPEIPLMKDWLVQVAAVGGIRGMALGVALGTIAAGVRILLGQDRPYSGESKK